MSLLDWHRRFFGPTTGAGESLVAARERALGVRLPAGLRELLAGADCNLGHAPRLFSVERLDVFDGHLVFALDGEARWWGVRADAGDDPPVQHGVAPGLWEDTRAPLSAFLRWAVAGDRTSCAPCVVLLSLFQPDGWAPPGWEAVPFRDRLYLVRGSVVLSPAAPGFLGARTLAELRAAIDALPVDPSQAPIEEYSRPNPPQPVVQPWRTPPGVQS